MTVLWIVLGIVAVLLIAEIIISYKLCSVMLKPRCGRPERILQRCIEANRFTQEFYDSADKEFISIDSQYGYALHGLILNNEMSKLPENRTRVAVLCHGITSAKASMIGYAQILMSMGFTAVMFDHRNHGDNEKCFTTMGYYEKFDLNTIIDYCYKRYGNDIRVVTYGESMGSGTILNHLAVDNRVICAVADCPFSDLKELCYHQLSHIYKLPVKIIMPVASLILCIRSGIKITDVSPREGVIKTKAPILFIHGSEDDFVPTHMSEDMYKLGTSPKQLYISKGATHAVSCTTNTEEYEGIVIEFIKKYYFGD